MSRYYVAILEKSSTGFGVFFPDVPGCTSAGATAAEAADNAEEALRGHLLLDLEDGASLPDATPLDLIQVDPDVDEAARVLVRFDPPAKSARVNITLPEDLLRQVDSYAETHGFTRSGLLAQAAREAIRRGA